MTCINFTPETEMSSTNFMAIHRIFVEKLNTKPQKKKTRAE